jgi:hypothetical protein
LNRLLRLSPLAPDIVQAILEGRQPKVMQLEELTDAIPSEWEAQRSRLRPSGQESTAVRCDNRNLSTLERGMIAAPVFA